MGAKYISSLPDASAGQGVFVPGFQSIGADLLTVTESSSFNWLVVVLNANRAAFEAAAIPAAAAEDPSGVLAAQVAAYGIRDRDNVTGGFKRAVTAPLYVVRWSTSPRGDPGLVANHLQNIYSDAFRQPVLARVMAFNASFMTPIVPGLTQDVTAQLSPPSSVVFSPSWTHPDSSYSQQQGSGTGTVLNNTGRAMCANGWHWDVMLSQAGPRSIASALLVLQDPAGTAVSFTWNGVSATFVGAGDLASALLPRDLQQHSQTFTVNATGDVWHVTLYPTPALFSQFVSNKPRNTALAVIAASLACVILFGCAAPRCGACLSADAAWALQHLRVPRSPPRRADEQDAERQRGAAAKGAPTTVPLPALVSEARRRRHR